MGYWKRHPYKDLEIVLEKFAAQGWRIENPPKYYTLYCPCGLHYRQFHLTPSTRNYEQHALRWAARQCPMWKGIR